VGKQETRGCLDVRVCMTPTVINNKSINTWHLNSKVPAFRVCLCAEEINHCPEKGALGNGKFALKGKREKEVI